MSDPSETSENEEGVVFGDVAPLATDPSPDFDSLALQIRPKVISKALSVLLADAQRGEGRLNRVDVNRTYLRRQLSISECIEVENQIILAGVAIAGDEDDEAVEYSGEERKEAPKRGHLYLTHSEERELARCVQLAAALPLDVSGLDSKHVNRIRNDADRAKR